MDSVIQLNRLRNRKGSVLVLVALLMLVLCSFLALTVDLGYMFVAKGQLQNAADAAALAGATALKTTGSGPADPNDLVQLPARNLARNYAPNNKAAGDPVEIASDNSNTLSSNNDITVGHWDGTSYIAGAKPVNAIQARARRTADSPGSEVELFISRVIGINTMGASAEAVASLTVKANNYISFCAQACGGNIYPVFGNDEIIVDSSNDGTNTGDYSKKFAWSTLLTNPTSNSSLVDIICGGAVDQEVCGEKIYTTMGTDQDSLKSLESVFYNPAIDAGNKVMDEATGTVKGWWALVPVTKDCPPGLQGSWNDPKLVDRYAYIRIKAVCAAGGGNACGNFTAPKNACSSYPNNVIVIDRMSCVGCADIYSMIGLKASLVR